MTVLSGAFKKLAGWARNNKLAAVACASVSLAGGIQTFVHHSENVVHNPAARDQQWNALQADIDGLKTAQKDYDSVDTFASEVKGAPGLLATPIDMAKLDLDRERLEHKMFDQQNKTATDFFGARDLSLNDIGAVRDRLRKELHNLPDYVGFANEGYLDEDIRSCQNRAANGGRNVQECLYYDRGTSPLITLEAIEFLAGALGVFCAGKIVMRNMKQDDAYARKVELPAELQTSPPGVPAEAEDPIALSAPTKISAPLKLQLKNKPAPV